MVFLFVPNIIGYFRFALLFAVLFTYQEYYILTIILYGMSQALDAFDGLAARALNQCSSFGAVLDMVCDRASNAVLLAILGSFYSSMSWLFYGDIILDLTSHWFQMYSAVVSGQHHKTSKTTWKLLELYYKKYVLFTLVFGNQLFLITCYSLHFISEEYTNYLEIPLILGLILFSIKKIMSFVQLCSACQKIAKIDQLAKEIKKI